MPSLRYIYFLLLSLSVHLAHSSITLDQIYPDWSFTTAKLLPTTSSACKAAYRAPIACDETLLGQAASMRGSYFDPTPDDFNRTCTLSCRDSIDNFLLGLIKSCSSSGDGAPRDIGFGNTGVYEPDADPVHVVGWILQYTFAQSCARDSQGQYCAVLSRAANNEFFCNDKCNLQFYTHAHNFPGAHWRFNHYVLISQSSWWENYFIGGWHTALACGAVEENTRYADVKAVLAGEKTTKTTASAVPSVSASASASASYGSGNGNGQPGGAGGATTGGNLVTFAGAPDKSVQTSGGKRLRGLFAGHF